MLHLVRNGMLAVYHMPLGRIRSGRPRREKIDTMPSMSVEPASPKIIKFVPAAILVGGLGWTGLIWLFLNTQPFEAGYRWLFFLCWFLAITGSSLPGVAFLNRRF